MKNLTRQSRKYLEIPVIWQCFEVTGTPGHFFLNKKFMYVQGEYLYPISNLYRLFFDSRVRHKEIFMRVYVCRAVFICVTPPGQTKHDTDLKFSTHTHIDFI